MPSNITKNQHYVPQFLLRGFSDDRSNFEKISIFDFFKKEVRFDQSIAEVFSQNYFYDTDNEIESFLSREVEGPAAGVIDSVRKGDFSKINGSSFSTVMGFVMCQEARTAEARDDGLNYINASFGQILADFSHFNDLDLGDINEWRVTPSDKDSMRSFVVARTLNGIIDSVAMKDLRFHILCNETEQEFIISDHPVVRYNWLYRNLEDPRVSSILARGVQLFVPLSSSLYLCAYDPKVYKYGLKNSDSSSLISINDVEWLNKLQILSARSFVAFSANKMKSTIIDLCQKCGEGKIYTRLSSHLGRENMKNGDVKTTHMVYTKQLKLQTLPSFFKIIKKSKKLASHFEVRNSDTAQALQILKQ
ncbi:DUF4238 domain-containing protein [Chitinibacter sp. GC72]|uniref:DUF4238 domain-containing protein n=1 Tax=Chitinibacter sp. GC72 TaxID=1526917 RepID=UPI0012F8EB99|nr:DUF4238 domain-containing protein [Chitinibacter sp. GC72]